MENLEENVAVGQGSFGAVVFKAKSKVHGCISDAVVVKKLLVEGEEDQKNFIKEASLLLFVALRELCRDSAKMNSSQNCRRVKLAALGERGWESPHEGAVHTGVPKGENALHYAWSLIMCVCVFFLSANQLIINLLTR